jgi:hypothetical protein
LLEEALGAEEPGEEVEVQLVEVGWRLCLAKGAEEPGEGCFLAGVERVGGDLLLFADVLQGGGLGADGRKMTPGSLRSSCRLQLTPGPA